MVLPPESLNHAAEPAAANAERGAATTRYARSSASHGNAPMSRGRPIWLLSRLFLLAVAVALFIPEPTSATASSSIGVSNLGSRLCKANPFTVWVNETGQGAAGALIVHVLATRDLLPYCDVHIIAPEGAGVVMHFLSANLRRAHHRRRRLQPSGSVHSAATAGCVDTVSVVHALSDELAMDSNVTVDDTGGTIVVGPTCIAATLTNRHHVSTHEPAQALTRIRLMVGDRDDRSIVGYTLKFSVYLHGNWTVCPYANQFQCKDDNCIWNKLICDGLLNCLDRSDEYEATYAVCRHPLRIGLQILCFFGAVGAIVTTLLTLDALGRYVLHSREIRSKQTRRPRARSSPVIFLDEEQPAATMRGADGGPINPLDRDLALFEKRGTAESRGRKKGKTAEGSKKPAPIEEAPRLSSAVKMMLSPKSSPNGLGAGRLKSRTSLRSTVVSSRASSSKPNALDAKMSTLSYDLDFDVDSSKLRVPDVTPEDSMLVEDDRHFPSDKPVKTSEAFMRMLELTVGKRSVPEHRGLLPAMLLQKQSSTATSSKTISLEQVSSSATSQLPRASTPLSSPTQSLAPLPKHTRTPGGTPETSCASMMSSPSMTNSPSMVSSPSAISSSQSVRPRHSTSDSKRQQARSYPSSSSVSRTGRDKSKESKAKAVSPLQSKDSNAGSYLPTLNSSKAAPE